MTSQLRIMAACGAKEFESLCQFLSLGKLYNGSEKPPHLAA